MRILKESDTRKGFVLRDVLISSLIVGLSIVFVETHLHSSQAEQRQARCASNAREVGMALFMYAADYDGKLPTSVGSFHGMVTSTQPYLRDSSRFYCPETNQTGETRQLGFRTPPLYAGLPISGDWPDPYLGGQRAEPERTILLFESDTDQGIGIAPSYRHNGGATALMFTGRAAWEQGFPAPPKAP